MLLLNLTVHDNNEATKKNVVVELPKEDLDSFIKKLEEISEVRCCSDFISPNHRVYKSLEFKRDEPGFSCRNSWILHFSNTRDGLNLPSCVPATLVLSL